MAAPNLNPINQEIDNDLKDNVTGDISPGVLRGNLKKITDWVKASIGGASAWMKLGTGTAADSATETISRLGRVMVGRDTDDGSGALFQASDLSAGRINRGFFNEEVVIQPVGPNAVRYRRVMDLPVSNAGSYDLTGMQITAGDWESDDRGRLIAVFGARGTFSCYYEPMGRLAGVGMVAYRNASGTTTIFLKMPNAYRVAIVTTLATVQTVLYPDMPEVANGQGQPAAPTGTLIYDTTQPDTYKPNFHTQPMDTIVGLLEALAQKADLEHNHDLLYKPKDYVPAFGELFRPMTQAQRLALAPTGWMGVAQEDGATGLYYYNKSTGGWIGPLGQVANPPVTPTLQSIAVTGPSSINEGTTADYVATGTYSDSTTRNITADVLWTTTEGSFSPSTPGRLSVDANLALGDGRNLTVTATLQTRTGTRTVGVVDTTPNPAPRPAYTLAANSPGRNLVPAGVPAGISGVDYTGKTVIAYPRDAGAIDRDSY